MTLPRTDQAEMEFVNSSRHINPRLAHRLGTWPSVAWMWGPAATNGEAQSKPFTRPLDRGISIWSTRPPVYGLRSFRRKSSAKALAMDSRRQ